MQNDSPENIQIENLTELKNRLIHIYNNLDTTNLSEIKKQVSNTLYNYSGVDWIQYIKINECKYHRELLYTSDTFDLVIITWGKGQQCPIHNHPNNGCTVKILHNHITEELYNTESLKVIRLSNYKKDDIMYIDDNLGYHKMCNKGNGACVTLHVYAPGQYKPTFFNSEPVR